MIQSVPKPLRSLRALSRIAGFTLMEASVAAAILAVGLLSAFATSLMAGKMVAGSEEEGRVTSALEQRMDDLRLLEWPELTDGTGITTKVYTARPAAMTGITVTSETFTISACDVTGAQTLTATWNGVAAPTKTLSGGTALSGASAVKVIATLSWTGRRSSQPETRSMMTVISRGGISKSDRP